MAAEWTFPKMFRLDGKVALITGGARGLGLAMATGLAEAGAEVVLADILRDEGEEKARDLAARGQKAHYRTIDVSDRDGVFAAMNEVADALGGIDVLINNAGVGGKSHGGPFAAQEMTPEHWRALMSINLDGPFACCQAVHPVMKARGGGAIINIASVWGLGASSSMPVAAYASSKGALVNLTRQLAVEWARDGIRVNAIAPGFFDTQLAAGGGGGGGGPEADWKKKMREQIGERMPMGRRGAPEEIKGAAIFLASEASGLVTGHTLPVDGGWMAW